MNHYLVVAILATCSMALEGASMRPPAQSPISKASATIELVPKSPLVIIHVTNLSQAPLDALQMDISSKPTSGLAEVLDLTIDFSSYAGKPGTPGRGSIQPGETRDVTHGLNSIPVSASVVVRMLLFEGGISEGSEERAEHVIAQRELRAVTFGVLIDALEAASHKPMKEARAGLLGVLASGAVRSRAGQENDSVSKEALVAVTDILRTSDTDAVLKSRIAALKERFEWQRERALRHRSR